MLARLFASLVSCTESNRLLEKNNLLIGWLMWLGWLVVGIDIVHSSGRFPALFGGFGWQLLAVSSASGYLVYLLPGARD